MHFFVLCVGDDVHGLMRRFDLNRELEPYRVHVAEADLERLREHYRAASARGESWTRGMDITNDVALVAAQEGIELNPEVGEPWVGRDDEGVYYLSTYNFEGRHDGYELGGHWGGVLRLKPGARALDRGTLGGRPHHCDERWVRGTRTVVEAAQARLQDLDFALMEAEDRLWALARWDEVADVISATSDPEPWAQLAAAAETGRMSWQEARQRYEEQPRVAGLRARGVKDVDSFSGHSRESYAEKVGRGGWIPRVLIADGEWTADPRLPSGADAAWVDHVRQMVLGRPPETVITVVDCHI